MVTRPNPLETSWGHKWRNDVSWPNF